MSTQSLYEKARNEGPSIYYDPLFRSMIESHMNWLLNHPKTSSIQINDKDAYVYRGDFDGLLTKLNIPKHLHWIFMRMNGMVSPLQYDGVTTILKVIDDKVITDLQRLYKTVETLS